MKKFRRITVATFTLLICFIFVPVAFAHPLGNFTINHYAGLQVTPDSVAIDFVIDMAEIPAFQEITAFDANGNGMADVAEAAGYHAKKCASLQPDLDLLLNNKPLILTLISSSVEFPAGAGGLPTLRLTCEFSTAIAGQMTSLSFVDNSYSERIGWREIVVTADGVKLNGDYSSTSVSKRLTSYPQDLLSNPLDQRQITLGIDAAAPTQDDSANAASLVPSIAGSRSDAFTQLITLQNLTLPTILFALLISFVWGAMHAMTPGHGKTIVGAYLVGSRGTIKHAIYLGLTTTITHTLGVFALGLITLFAAQFIVPEKLFPWLSLLSGLFVVGIGINLMVSRFKSSEAATWLGKLKVDLTKSRALTSPIFQYEHAEVAGHEHKLVIGPSQEHFHSHDLAHPHSHNHEHAHPHDHVHADHSHLPPGAEGEPVTWRSLLALGISGGLLPCPSALVVLLGAIALNRIGFGLILVLAFSLGLAGALTAIGMMFIYAGRLFNRFPVQGKIIRFLPVLSALFVSAIGVGIAIKALKEIGVL